MPQATMVACPKCGAKVRKEKLRRHINNVHGEGAKTPVLETVEPVGPASTVRFPWKVVAVLGVVAALVGGGYYVVSNFGGGGSAPARTVAVMETNMGAIRITIDKNTCASGTAGHFTDLVRAARYDGTGFTRVAWVGGQGFVIQGGQGADTTTRVPWEATCYTNSAYSVAMARSGDNPNDPSFKDTATDQFFINLRANPSLDTGSVTYGYVVFGHVDDAASQAVVRAIGNLYPPGQPNYDGPPTTPVTISHVSLTTR